MDLRCGAMKSDWKSDKAWADKFLPDIIKILAKNAGEFIDIDEADIETDARMATDLVITIKGGQVAVRIRRNGYGKYRDWTIRSRRDSGQKTELEKLQEGFARWYLYLWTTNSTIVDWILIDLNRVRDSGILQREYREISNGDGTHFIPIKTDTLKWHQCLIAEFQEDDYQPPLFKII